VVNGVRKMNTGGKRTEGRQALPPLTGVGGKVSGCREESVHQSSRLSSCVTSSKMSSLITFSENL
jgi:hypothetical protein